MRIDRDHAALAVGALVSLATMALFDRDGPRERFEWLDRVEAAHHAAPGGFDRAGVEAPAAAAPAAERTAAARPAPAGATRPAEDQGANAPRPLRAAEAERLAAHVSDNWRIPLPQARRIVSAAARQAQQQRLSPTLVLAVVARESSFRHDARSAYGAHGLMQVVPRHHPEKVAGLGRDALLAPETNIAVGTRVLAEYLAQGKGRLDAALVKYSGDARDYPASVRRLWREFEAVRRAVRVET